MKSATRLARRIQLSAFVLFTATLLIPQTVRGQDQTPPATSPDNSGQNKAHATTADQQSEATQDRMLTKKIRQAIIADKSLSMYAHNVKIIVQNGAVTLKGPVKSDDEKQSIAAKAAEIAGGADKVTNQLTVKQS
jgi:hyperosmotically inducible periplasmic protein